jgi:hypothetical protein
MGEGKERTGRKHERVSVGGYLPAPLEHDEEEFLVRTPDE